MIFYAFTSAGPQGLCSNPSLKGEGLTLIACDTALNAIIYESNMVLYALTFARSLEMLKTAGKQRPSVFNIS